MFFYIVLVHFEISGQPSLARGVLAGQQMALPALAPHDLACAGHFEPSWQRSDWSSVSSLPFAISFPFQNLKFLQLLISNSGDSLPPQDHSDIDSSNTYCSYAVFALAPSSNVMFLPSRRGDCSTMASFCSSVTMRSSTALPWSIWAISLPAEHDRHFDLVALFKEPLDVVHLEIDIMVVRPRSQLDFFDNDDGLVFSGFVRPSWPSRICTSRSP